jgi:hypothetical protein
MVWKLEFGMGSRHLQSTHYIVYKTIKEEDRVMESEELNRLMDKGET